MKTRRRKEDARLDWVSFMRASVSIDSSHCDMLRYDHAFSSRKDPTILAFPTYKLPNAGGKIGGNCTLDRWRTFGVRLVPILCESIDLERELRTTFPSLDWFTVEHPRDEQDRPVYTDFEELTCEEYVERLKVIHGYV